MTVRSSAGTPGPFVLHCDLQSGVGSAHLDLGGAAAVLAGVVEQVGDDAHHPALVRLGSGGPPRFGVELHGGIGRRATMPLPGAPVRQARMGLRSSRAAPASKREISSRSSDQLLEPGDIGDHQIDGGLGRRIGHVVAPRRRGPRSRPRGSSAGERSSWLTSEAKRPSWSMRVSSTWAMWFERRHQGCRGLGSSTAPRRVSRRPPAMASAATDTSARGRSVRPAGPEADEAAPTSVTSTGRRRTARSRSTPGCSGSRPSGTDSKNRLSHVLAGHTL